MIGIAAAFGFDTGVHGLFISGTSSSFVIGNAAQQRHIQPRIQISSNQLPRRIHKLQTLRSMLDVGNLFKGTDPPSQNVLRAVESEGLRVTAADIASSVGMSLTESQKALSTLAMLTSGTLQVSKDGEIVYEFDPNFRNILRARYITPT